MELQLVKVQGIIVYSPQTFSATFTPEDPNSICAETLPWLTLTIGHNLESFVNQFNLAEKELGAISSRCFQISANFIDLSDWFDQAVSADQQLKLVKSKT